MTNPAVEPRTGVPETLAPDLRRIVAPNPSPMTFRGTNTYIVGEGAVTVIDPGPRIASHHTAIKDALAPNEKIARILVTHAHRDHSMLARPLADDTGAPVYAFGGATDGRSEIMIELASAGLSGGGEGLDTDFAPDEILHDGDEIAGLRALHTPGHAASHLCFQCADQVFTGDIVMGWASTLVSPPDGDLTEFMASTQRLANLDARVFYPGHGDPIDGPSARCHWLIDHRRAREDQILGAIGPNGASVAEITRAVYTDVPPALLPAARRNVFAHLIDLVQRSRLKAVPSLNEQGRFHLLRIR